MGDASVRLSASEARMQALAVESHAEVSSGPSSHPDGPLRDRRKTPGIALAKVHRGTGNFRARKENSCLAMLGVMCKSSLRRWDTRRAMACVIVNVLRKLGITKMQEQS